MPDVTRHCTVSALVGDTAPGVARPEADGARVRHAPASATTGEWLSRAPRLRVLEEDPDLAGGLSDEDRESAVKAAVAPVYILRRGPWSLLPEPDPSSLGALILDGLIAVRIDSGSRAHLELLGPGDVISPWVGMGPDLALAAKVTTLVVSPVRIALLDRDFALRSARWPQIAAALAHRLVIRGRRLSLQAAINSLPRTLERVELTLWMQAYRFGRVTNRGHVVHLPISHFQLAALVAATRPSVSVSLSRLQRTGRLVRADNHIWILTGSPPRGLGGQPLL
ncbi:MAG TPA: Crp/Fnr family transcriptional regulator [Solirubrobacteraceae bacterium]|nr:Crp/Fnr family transcriptional regulator [Solirubrobacteraceae bacterium]